MKKVSVSALFMLILISSSFASPAPNPDFKGSDNFNKTFPQATEIAYKVVDKITEVNFTWHSLQLQAFYDLDGNYIGMSRKMNVKDLPLTYLINVKKAYPEFELTEAIEFDHAETGLSYYVTVVNGLKRYVLEVGDNGTVSIFQKMKK